MPTDLQLQLALAKMLPDKLKVCREISSEINDFSPEPPITGIMLLHDYTTSQVWEEIKDTEWLGVCWLVEETLKTFDERASYVSALYPLLEIEATSGMQHEGDWRLVNASWQQRALALCKVKGVEL